MPAWSELCHTKISISCTELDSSLIWTMPYQNLNFVHRVRYQPGLNYTIPSLNCVHRVRCQPDLNYTIPKSQIVCTELGASLVGTIPYQNLNFVHRGRCQPGLNYATPKSNFCVQQISYFSDFTFLTYLFCHHPLFFMWIFADRNGPMHQQVMCQCVTWRWWLTHLAPDCPSPPTLLP